MADPIREKIRAAVVAELVTITTVNGFQQDVGDVLFAHETTINVDGQIVLLIRDGGEQKKRHLRGAYENRMLFEIRAFIREDDDKKRLEALQRLSADVEKVIVTDETHGGLAKKTNLQLHTVQLGEPIEPLGTHIVTAEVMYRVKRTDPFTQTEI